MQNGAQGWKGRYVHFSSLSCFFFLFFFSAEVFKSWTTRVSVIRSQRGGVLEFHRWTFFLTCSIVKIPPSLPACHFCPTSSHHALIFPPLRFGSSCVLFGICRLRCELLTLSHVAGGQTIIINLYFDISGRPTSCNRRVVILNLPAICSVSIRFYIYNEENSLWEINFKLCVQAGKKKNKHLPSIWIQNVQSRKVSRRFPPCFLISYCIKYLHMSEMMSLCQCQRKGAHMQHTSQKTYIYIYIHI